MSNSLAIIVITLVVYVILFKCGLLRWVFRWIFRLLKYVYSHNRQYLTQFFSLVFKTSGRFFSWILGKLCPSLRESIVSKTSAMETHVLRLWTILQGWMCSHSPKWKEEFSKISDNLAVGLVIAAVMFVLHSFPILSDIEDAGMDLMMQARQKLIPAIREKNIPSFVFLDIDDETYRNWKEPLLTPRKELTKLIDIAVRWGASLIIVDFDLSQKIPTEDGKKLHTEDETLKAYLVDYAKGCKSKPMCPSIILVRAFRTPEQVQPVSLWESFKSLENFKLFLHPSLEILEPRIGFLEEETDVEFKPYVLWASALFFRSPYDQVVRRWKLWQSTCLNRQQPGITYSIELLATSIIRNCTATRALEKLDEALKDKFQPKPENCTDGSLTFSPSEEIPKTVNIGELTVSTDRKDTRQRILYSMPWGENTLLTDTEGKHILSKFSAGHFLANPEDEEILKDFKDKIVFIGGSYGEGRDSHLTPLGQMPGALVVINAIHSLLQYETIEPVSSWLKWLLEVVFIVIISILFRMFSSFFGMLVSGIVIISILLPMSVVFFEYGIWLDFALPLLAVVLHRMIEDFKGDENKGEEETKVVMRKIVVRTGLKPFRTRRTKRPLP